MFDSLNQQIIGVDSLAASCYICSIRNLKREEDYGKSHETGFGVDCGCGT